MATAFDIARNMLGKGEIPDRAAIQDYLATGGVNLDPITTAWCAAFVNSSLKQAGIPGTGSNLARSFLKYGQEITQPQRGDIAVFSRGDPKGPYGHVGFFEGFDPNGDIRLLAGNQGDAVSEASVPAARLLGYRRPLAPGTPAPPLPPAKNIIDHPIAPAPADAPAPMQQPIDEKPGLGALFAAMAPGAGNAAQAMAPADNAPVATQGSGDPLGATMAALQADQKGRGLATGLMPDIASLMGLGKRPGAVLA